MENSAKLTEQLRNFISETTFTDKEKIKEDTLVFKESIFDSLGFLSLISYIEEELGVEVADDELLEENFESINAIAAFVTRKTNAQ
ncbi:acyl carrier protein [Mariniphaga sp.]|uniref:acyl carrier protein n=1 Tax=Mariniphaga sp. TaxID=1954475 RepID=UPI003564DEB7